MPAENFAPAAGGNVDPSKIYLIKGGTLAELLKKTTFDPEDFEVTEQSTGRTIHVRNKYDQQTPGKNLNLTIRYWAEDTTGHIIEMAAPDVLYFRRGLFVGIIDPEDQTDEVIEKTVACFSASS